MAERPGELETSARSGHLVRDAEDDEDEEGQSQAEDYAPPRTTSHGTDEYAACGVKGTGLTARNRPRPCETGSPGHGGPWRRLRTRSAVPLRETLRASYGASSRPLMIARPTTAQSRAGRRECWEARPSRQVGLAARLALESGPSVSFPNVMRDEDGGAATAALYGGDGVPQLKRGQRSRIMYIEDKSESLSGPARIGRVTFSKTGKTIYYRGRAFANFAGGGFKANFCDVETGDQFWISGPRRDGADRLYGEAKPVEIDEDVRAEYWSDIRSLPERRSRLVANG